MPKMITSLAREAERHRREHAAEREDAGEAVAVHRARDQEPERRAVVAEQRRDVAARAPRSSRKKPTFGAVVRARAPRAR